MNKRAIMVNAPAKLNLGLSVTGIRSDNYHDIDTIFAMVDIYDEIWLSELKNDIIIKCNHPLVPLDSNNIVYKAVNKMQQLLGVNQGAMIEIKKSIPVGGGMAGGSTDAAAVLRALPVLWGIDILDSDIIPIAKSLGADVLYCYLGGIKRGKGIGTDLIDIMCNYEIKFAVLPQPWPISTPKAFSAWDSLSYKQYVNIEVIKDALQNNIKQFNLSLGNSLENAVAYIEPKLKEVIQSIRSHKLNVQMTGSGSTLFLVMENDSDLEKLKDSYKGSIIQCNLITKLPDVNICKI